MNPESRLQRMQSSGQAFNPKRVNQKNRKTGRFVVSIFGFGIFS
jgi:hypothetical protein